MKRLKVVIPCRNEVNHIQECIASVMQAGNRIDGQMEVFIVDGKSDDGTLEVISELIRTYANLHLVVNEHQLTPYAFNLGIKTDAPFDFLAIVGSRHVLSENYFEESLKVLEKNPETWCVGGRVDNVYADENGKITAMAMGTAFGMGIGNFRAVEKSGYVDTVGTPVYPAWVFEKVGYFDEELTRNQDDEFNYRVTKAGGNIYYLNDISVRYYVRTNLKQLKKQFLQYGYWKVYVNKKHKAVTTFRQLVPPAFVLYLLLFPFCFLISWKVGLLAASLLVMYLIMSAVVSLKLGESVNEVVRIFRIFPIIHSSYGWGYLKGIWAFFIWKTNPNKKYNELSR